MHNQVLVSVICLAFNHEKYIRDCLEGFVSQKTDFAYEVIIHDDASTDQTAAIIREYECRYPDIIKPIYQTENQYSRRIPITKTYILPKVRGQFIAICEGDDYWTDTCKLQKQADALRQHPQCNMCTHKVAEVFECGTANGVNFPNVPLETGVLSARQFYEIGKQYSFHTSSYFFTAEHYRKYCMDPPEFVKKCDVGDETMMLYFGLLGDVMYISDEMSCYRRGVAVSWTSGNLKNYDRMITHGHKMVETLKAFDEYSEKQYHDIMCRRIAMQMARTVILENNASVFLKKENLPYFRCLSGRRKLFVLLSAVAPRLMRKVYVHRIEQMYSDRGV